MKLRFCLLALVALSPMQSMAEDVSGLISEVAGAYKHTHTIKFVQLSPNDAESAAVDDLLEIVPYKDQGIYFQASLNFYNGHTCDISGIAKLQDGEFIMKRDRCEMSIDVTDTHIDLVDLNDECRQMSCGARGSYDNEKGFARSTRKRIANTRPIKVSEQYSNAVKAFEEQR